MASVPTSGGGGFGLSQGLSFIANLGFSYLMGRMMAQDGPRLANLNPSSGEYGVPMPRIHGEAVRLEAPWLALDDIKETEHEVEDYSEVVGAISGAAQGWLVGGPVGAAVGAAVGFVSGLLSPDQKYYTYSITGALLIADRTGDLPIEGLLKGWSVGKVIFDASQQSPTSTTLDSNGNLLMAEYGKNKYFKRLRVYGGGNEQTADSILDANLEETQPGYRWHAYVVFEDFQLEYFGNSVPSFELLAKAKTGETLAEFLSKVGSKAGIDVTRNLSSALMSNVTLTGYALTEETTCWDAIKPLQPLYRFDSAEIAGNVSFFPRGNGMRATIPLEHMGAYEWGQDPPERITLRSAADSKLPKEAHLTFIDPERDYQTNTASSIRAEGNTEDIINTTVRVTLTANEGASAVATMHWDAWLGRSQASFSVTDAWMSLQPGVTYAIPLEGEHLAYRISNKLRGPNGIIEVEAFSDEDVVYAAVETLTSGEIGEQSTAFPSTFVVAMDMPITSDAHDDYGFYVAMGTDDASWKRGKVMVSSDNITYGTLIDHDQTAIMGSVTNIVAPGPTTGWDDTLDTTSIIEVTLLRSDMVLTSATDAQLDAFANFCFVGKDGLGEFIQFKTATQTGPLTWELTNLRRGRRGTDHYIGEHVADEQFVLLGKGGIYRVPVLNNTGWGDLLYLKGVTLFQDVDDPSINEIQFTNTGEGKRPFSVINLDGTWTSGDLNLTWEGRSRFYDDANSTDTPVTYEIDIYRNGINVRNVVGLLTEDYTYTTANIATDGFTISDDIEVRVFQENSVYGRSRARIDFFINPEALMLMEDDTTPALMEDGTTEIEMG